MEKCYKILKAVVVVNLYGQSADFDNLKSICDKYNVPLVEDAAESVGATYKGKQTGTIGNIGIYSFNGNKIITTSGDGIITYFRKLLRSTSIDEFLELVNVVLGNMSLVGSRPLLVEYKDLYSSEQWRRHEVRTGITGWAQVNGRNSISWSERFKLDVEYIDNYNLILDIKILFMTVLKVIKKDGISQDGHVTMEKFNGNN